MSAARAAADFKHRMVKDFYSCLFDHGQFTCYGETHKGVRVSRVKAQTQFPLFTINALDPACDHEPTESYHSYDKPRRADHNIVCLRNILLEMDVGTTDEQMSAVIGCGIPWSTCVSSGSKSLHFIISLEDALEDRSSYRKLVERVYNALQHERVKVDIANKNPSRFSRAPGAKRPETGRKQEPLAVYGRVANRSLLTWLDETLPVDEPKFPAPRGKIIALPETARIYASTREFLRSGAPTGEWNISLFRAACNLFSAGYSFDRATSELQSVTGTLDASDMATIKSAYRRASTG